MNNGEGKIDLNSYETNDPVTVDVPVYGSWVFKQDIRRILGINRSEQYLEEIEILKKDLDGFAKLYKENSQKRRIRVEVARVIICTILERANGTKPEIRVKYQE